MKTGKLMEKEKSETGSVAWNTYAIYLRISRGRCRWWSSSCMSARTPRVWHQLLLGDWSQDSTFPERANDTDWGIGGSEFTVPLEWHRVWDFHIILGVCLGLRTESGQ
ncbi:hypothetical protein BV898_16847 [Hypsibius exemplaris]|uniref:Uncharacterized protein n=1 Tax=Hypsibius exemplaris TaxID=2072580 RepID=A0A9X6NL89_HYPEX|nr:hypothetical protein BV898_16847 [Hypsibius exemplaris]